MTALILGLRSALMASAVDWICDEAKHSTASPDDVSVTETSTRPVFSSARDAGDVHAVGEVGGGQAPDDAARHLRDHDDGEGQHHEQHRGAPDGHVDVGARRVRSRQRVDVDPLALLLAAGPLAARSLGVVVPGLVNSREELLGLLGVEELALLVLLCCHVVPYGLRSVAPWPAPGNQYR